MLPGFIEPDEGVGQIEEGDAPLADDLQIGRAAEGGRFSPLRGDVAAASDLGDWASADFACRRKIERHD